MSSDLEVIHLKERIVFISGGADIYTVDSNGSNLRHLTSVVVAGFVCSNNAGTKIYCLDNGGFTSMDPDGGNLIYLFGLSGTNWISFSPDDKTIFYQILLNVRKVNSDGSGDVLFLANSSYPSFSPSGDRIAYISGLNVYTVKPDGTNTKQIASFPTATDISYTSWSPEGTKVLCEVQEAGVFSIVQINVNTSEKRYIYSSTSGIYSPVYSPDGYKIAFILGTAVCIIGLDGSGLREISGGLNCTGNVCFVGKSN